MVDTSLYNTTTIKMIMVQAPEVIRLEKDNARVMMKKFQDTGIWNLPVIKEGVYLGLYFKIQITNRISQKVD